MEVLRISKWNETFATAESRRLKSLPWVALPTSFQSHGLHDMIDTFGDDAPAIYGCWCALVKLAANCHVRGVLATSRGVPFSLARIARLTYFPATMYERLIEWATQNEIGWIEVVESSEIDWNSYADTGSDSVSDTDSDSENPMKTGTQQSPSDHPAKAQQRPSKSLGYITEQNITEHNTTTSLGVDVDAVDPSLVVPLANRLRKVCPPSTDRRLVWQIAWLSLCVDDGLVDELVAKLGTKGHGIQNIAAYIQGAARKACESAGCDWKRIRWEIPDPPPERKREPQEATA